MTMLIPEVGFNQSNDPTAELEVIKLESLYERSFTDLQPEHPHRLQFFILIYIERGTGSHMVDFEEYPYSPGSTIFVQRDQVHAFKFSSDVKGYLLLFTQLFLDQVHINMRLPNYTPTHLQNTHSPFLALDVQNNHRCKTLINEILLEKNHHQTDPLIVMYLFSSLSLIMHRLRPEMRHDNLSPEQSTKFARFFELLQSNFKSTRDAAWYAQQLHTTYKTLNQLTKLATGLTAKQLIDAYTIVEIKRHLVVNHASTQQMAYDFGFEDASNFVKYFKKHTTLTPSRFLAKYTR